jgi:1-phosphofructokinase family hexose kinase
MIFCINANSAIDRVIFIDRFLSGQTMRPEVSLDCIGGKGADAALVLSVLGAPHLLLSFMAGENGRQLEKLYRKFEICYELLWVEGETRFSNVIVETDFNRHSHITTKGYSVDGEDCTRFLKRVTELASAQDWVLIGGTLPEGAPDTFYGQVIEAAHQKGARTLIDCAGKPLIQVLSSGPDVVKLNRSEFAATFGKSPDSLIDLAEAARQALADFRLNAMVITLDKEGMLAVTPEEVYRAHGLQLKPVNAAGAGDAASAAITYRLSQGDDWVSVLQWAGAAGAAVVLTQGTAECFLEDILKFRSQVQVERLPLRD